MNLTDMIRFLFISIFIFSFNFNTFAQSTPGSFADLVEDLIPAVVSIASKTTAQEQSQQSLPNFPDTGFSRSMG